MTSLLGRLLPLALVTLTAPAALALPTRDETRVETQDEALRARLDALVEKLEAQREELHIPGMALVIVKDDAIVLAKGFGVSDFEKGTPVTPETLFAIGSSSKAFTTALISMLVAEGRMDWDAPITEYLPFFTLNVDSEDADATVTLRDLTSHRTGFTRMGILWAGGQVSRQEVLEVATGAEPWDGFRKNFHYNNVMYLAAGVAAARVAETDYDTLLRERLLEPLGMSSSNTSVVASQKDPRLALGYSWDADRAAYTQLPMRVLDTIAPAGAINSNVLDMAQWLRLQLADGVIDGVRLLDSEQIATTRTTQMNIGGGNSYGLGWMLGKWNGRKVVEHGGNIDGFGAAVALLPEEQLGFVLLTNVTSSPLQTTSLPMVWEAVLGGEEEAAAVEAAADTALDYDDYVGEFIANYAHFDEATFTVQVNQAGKLALDVPGQMLFELKDPDAEGRWDFALTDTIVVTFVRDADGVVQSLEMAQGGATFECPRKGYEFPLEFDLADVQPLLGRYDDPALGAEVEVVIENNRLAVNIPGQSLFTLQSPDEDDIWWFRAVPGLGLEFDVEDGEPASEFIFHEVGTQRYCTRVEGSVVELPDLADVLEISGLDARRDTLAELGALRINGSVRMAQSGVTGTFTWTVDGPERYLSVVDFGKFAVVEEVYADGAASARSTVSPSQEHSGTDLLQARRQNPSMPFGDWRLFGDTLVVAGREALDGRDTIRLRLATEELPAAVLWVDAETGDLLKLESKQVNTALGAELPYSVRFDDHREVHGVRIPHRVQTRNDASGNIIVVVEGVEAGVEVGPETFALRL